MNLDTFRQQALDHLGTGMKNFSTQFSSWASSLKVVIYVCKRPYREICKHCHISMVDSTLMSTQNVFVYVPSLEWLAVGCKGYKHEYLAHGVIEGGAPKAVPLKVVVGARIPESSYRGLSPAVVTSPSRHIEFYPAITEQELRNALSVAELYGGDFVVPVAVVILCQKTRDIDLWRKGNIPDLSIVAEALSDYNVPLDWCRTANILTDVVDSGGYGDVDQMILLLRALLHHRRGKGARFAIDSMEQSCPRLEACLVDERKILRQCLEIEH
jgi:hypothetical protein